jgi:hypothetical protein
VGAANRSDKHPTRIEGGTSAAASAEIPSSFVRPATDTVARTHFEISDADLRLNHEFVTAFETLRKQRGHREMHDAALRDVADSTGVPFETMRVARHVRNALAHGEPVNRETLRRLTGELVSPLSPGSEPPDVAPSPTTRAYRVHARTDEQLEQEMIANGFVSIGGVEIGDLTGVSDPETIRKALTDSMPDRKPQAIAIFVGYWRRFLWDASAGDLVVLPTRNGRVAIGEFVGSYHYVADAEPHARHRRAVSWNALDVDRDAFGADLITVLSGRHTIQEFKSTDALARLRALASAGGRPGMQGSSSALILSGKTPVSRTTCDGSRCSPNRAGRTAAVLKRRGSRLGVAAGS